MIVWHKGTILNFRHGPADWKRVVWETEQLEILMPKSQDLYSFCNDMSVLLYSNL